MATDDPPIEDVLDELVPDWREVTRKMKAEGFPDEAVVAEFQRRMHQQIDSLLDFYNALGGGSDGDD